MSWRAPLGPACWEAGTVSAIIPVEAETPSDGVFRSTHSALPIIQRDKVDSPEGNVVDEEALLEAVRRQPADYPVLPILGRSGSGKSHLVRWLRMNLELEPKTRLVFIPKHRTSLRGILELVLQHAPPDRTAGLRQRVDEAVDSLGNEQEARLRLRGELATLIETRGSQPGEHSPEEAELRDYLSQHLPALLLDPWFKQSLLNDRGAIARLVREKLAGKEDDDVDEEAFGFDADDVRFSVDDVRRASLEAQDVAGALASDDDLPRIAATMLNEQLGQAVSSVFGLGGDDLKTLLVELRLSLQESGEELLLLIEDFSIFQGIQGGLIDAITLIPSKELAVCPMRVVMAVTTGYFINRLPDTVKTRTYIAFDLDLPATADRRPDPVVFAAPYLNAVRVGNAALDAAYSRDEEVPNACNLCPVIASCHAAFGDVDGVGLFPFNRACLERAVKAKTGADDVFVARDVLNRVLRPVLHRDRAAIVDGEFPSEFFAREFATGAEGLLDIEDEARLERRQDQPATNERRKRLVRFWGSGGGPENLHATVHAAFAVPLIEGLQRRSKPLPPPTDEEVLTPPSPPPVVLSLPALVAATDRWIETGEIKQAEKRELRLIVHSFIVEQLELEDGAWGRGWWTDPSRAQPAFMPEAVYLGDEPRSAGGRLAGIKLEGGGSSDARALRGLAWFSGVGSWRLIPNGGVLQRLAYSKLREWSGAVEAQLLGSRDLEPDDELVAIVQALDAGAQIMGLSAAYRDDLVDRIGALVDLGQSDGTSSEPWPNLVPLVNAARTGEVAAAADREQLRNRLFRLASFSQAGSPLALDVPRVVRALKQSEKEARASGNTPDKAPGSVPDEVRRHLAVLQSGLAKLDQLADAMRQSLPNPEEVGADLQEAIAVVDDLLERLATFDLLPAGVVPALIREKGRAVKDGDPDAVAEAREKLGEWETLGQRAKLRVLTSDWYPPAIRLQSWIAAVNQALDKLEASLAAGAGGRLQQDMQSAAARLNEALDQFCVELDRLLDEDKDVIA